MISKPNQFTEKYNKTCQIANQEPEKNMKQMFQRQFGLANQ